MRLYSTVVMEFFTSTVLLVAVGNLQTGLLRSFAIFCNKNCLKTNLI
ncbi:MAG: hypothetical protein LBP59_18940 [Planctomycetaceae bacterium]|nr:hypothetical protein [Planctomycetaceae bacterium]